MYTNGNHISTPSTENRTRRQICNGLEDPFDEPLTFSDLELSDAEIADDPSTIIIEDVNFTFLKLPYMLFEDQLQTKRKLREAYTQHEFLLLYGYSGCDKSTIPSQFADRYPDYVQYFPDFASMSTVALIHEIGNRISLPLKQRFSELKSLSDALRMTQT